MNPTLAAIDQQTLKYTPAVIAGILAAEQLGAGSTGAEKASAVVGAVSASLAGSSNPNVAGIAALVNLGVFIANHLGVFKHKTA